MYKLYVRPHLDYGDIIHHIPHKISEFSHSFELTNQMEKLEAVQFSAALAVKVEGKGCDGRAHHAKKIYDELGWESLDLRRWSRRLFLFIRLLTI